MEATGLTEIYDFPIPLGLSMLCGSVQIDAEPYLAIFLITLL